MAISKRGERLRDHVHSERMNRPFYFRKTQSTVIGAHDETLSIAVCVHNPDRPPFKINSGDPAQAPTGFVEIVGDDFPVLHGRFRQLISVVSGRFVLRCITGSLLDPDMKNLESRKSKKHFIIKLVSLILIIGVANIEASKLSKYVDDHAPKNISWKKPLGDNGAGVTWRTPLGKNGAKLNAWVNKNKKPLIGIAITIAAIAVAQPELSEIGWADVALASGAATGIKMSFVPEKGNTSLGQQFELPMWAIGISPGVLQELAKLQDKGMKDPRIQDLMKFMAQPGAWDGINKALNEGPKIDWPTDLNAKLGDQITAMVRDASMPFTKFVYDYIQAHGTLVGADKDPQFLELQNKIGEHLDSIAELNPSTKEMADMQKQLKNLLSSKNAANKSASHAKP